MLTDKDRVWQHGSSNPDLDLLKSDDNNNNSWINHEKTMQLMKERIGMVRKHKNDAAKNQKRKIE